MLIRSSNWFQSNRLIEVLNKGIVLDMDTFDAESYWENRLRNDFNLQGVGFKPLGKNYNNWLYRIRRDAFLRILSDLQLNPESAKVLDVGCGTGFYINLWQELGAKKIYGIDISEYVISNLRRRYPQYQFSIFELGRDDENQIGSNYDCISAFDVLFHVVEDDKYRFSFEQISRLLKPGGLFLFSENFLHGTDVVSKHQKSRSIDTILSLLHESGFRIVDRVPMFYLMNIPIDSNNMLLKLYWRILNRIVRQSELAGLVMGAVIYPIELLLVRIMKESPSTEILICRKEHSTTPMP